MLKDLISALVLPSPDDQDMKHAATNASIASSMQIIHYRSVVVFKTTTRSYCILMPLIKSHYYLSSLRRKAIFRNLETMNSVIKTSDRKEATVCRFYLEQCGENTKLV